MAITPECSVSMVPSTILVPSLKIDLQNFLLSVLAAHTSNNYHTRFNFSVSPSQPSMQENQIVPPFDIVPNESTKELHR